MARVIGRLTRLAALLLCLVAPRAMAAIAYDATAGHNGTNACGSSPCVITISIIAGETGVCSVNALNSASSVTITGGGTWTTIKSGSNSSFQTVLLSNGAGGGSTAASVSVVTVGSNNVDVACVQYTGVGSIGSVASTNTTSSSVASVTINSTALASWIVAAMGVDTAPVTSNTGNLRAQDSGTEIGASAITDNALTPGVGSVVNSVNDSGGTVGESVGVELFPPTPGIQYDPVLANTGSARGSTTPLAVTVSIVSGETGFCAISLEAPTIVGVSVSSITGGGTWTLVKGVSAAATSRSELWTNGARGGSTASSVSIAFTGSVTQVVANCGQYIGANSILTANAVTAIGTTNETQTINLTTTAAGSFVVSSFAVNGTSPSYFADTGALRSTLTFSAVTAGALNDNASTTAASTTNVLDIGGTPVDWATTAVELSLVALSSGSWMMTGFGQ